MTKEWIGTWSHIKLQNDNLHNIIIYLSKNKALILSEKLHGKRSFNNNFYDNYKQLNSCGMNIFYDVNEFINDEHETAKKCAGLTTWEAPYQCHEFCQRKRLVEIPRKSALHVINIKQDMKSNAIWHKINLHLFVFTSSISHPMEKQNKKKKIIIIFHITVQHFLFHVIHKKYFYSKSNIC